jgi:hypothetical protein
MLGSPTEGRGGARQVGLRPRGGVLVRPESDPRRSRASPGSLADGLAAQRSEKDRATAAAPTRLTSPVGDDSAGPSGTLLPRHHADESMASARRYEAKVGEVLQPVLVGPEQRHMDVKRL